ncbi:MAG: UDP-2,3-diacylglucosamine diphosphatase [candidate division WOR-3 bacterium]
MKKLSAYYFIADAHLGAGTAEAEERLLCFLETVRSRANVLYVLGDLFDFGFEYRRVIPKCGVKILAELSRLRRDGTRVVYLPGNHDFRFGTFLCQEVEVPAGKNLEQEIDGLRVWMGHGDELEQRPVSVLFRSFSRSRTAHWLYSLLHPDVGVSLADWVARRSRERQADEKLRERMAEFAKTKLGDGFDVVVLAHSHLPELRRYGSGIYLNIGDWLENFTYGVISNRAVALERFEGPGHGRIV